MMVVRGLALAQAADLSRWRYRSSGMEQRPSAAFSASVNRAKNTPADSTVYPPAVSLKNSNT